MSFGEIEEKTGTPGEKEIRWKISNFFSLSKDKYVLSPDFKVLNVGWRLKIDPSESKNDHVALLLNMDGMVSTCDVLCTFGVIKADGSMVTMNSFKHSFSTQNVTLTMHKFLTRSTLKERESELMPLNKLTIVCHLKYQADPTKLTEIDLLSKNFKELLDDKDSCDAVLLVQDKEFQVHKTILIARSSVFAAMFKHDTTEKKTGEVVIQDCDPDSFPEFLEYIYTGRLENVSSDSALQLYYTSDKYHIHEIKKFCIKYLKENLTSQNICDVVVLADKYEETSLLSAAQNFFNENLEEIFTSNEWEVLFKKNFRLANKLLIEMSKVKK